MSSEVAVEMQGGKWKRYPAYRDSGVEWLGEVPEGWDMERLKYCATLSNKKVDGRESNLPYTGLEHIESWTGRRISSDEIATSEGQSNRYECGDVLFGKLRPYLAKVFRGKNHGICTGELLVLRPKDVSQDYLFNYMLANDFISIVDSSTYGAKMPRASWDFIGNLPVLTPPLHEQHAIAAFLDRETGRIDTLIEKKERQIELLQEKRAALISHAVTKGLDPDVKMKDSGVEWLGEVPEHWGASKIIRYAYLKTGGTPDRNNMAYWENGTINWISSGEVNKKKIFETNNKITSDGLANSNAMILPINSIMVALNGQGKTKGTVAILEIESSCNQSLAAFICDEKKLHFNYLFYYLESKYKELRGLVGDSLRDGLSLGHLKSIDSPLPPIFEQRTIAAFLDHETGRIDALEKKVRKSIEKLREYRTALVSAAVTGKIDVRNKET